MIKILFSKSITSLCHIFLISINWFLLQTTNIENYSLFLIHHFNSILLSSVILSLSPFIASLQSYLPKHTSKIHVYKNHNFSTVTMKQNIKCHCILKIPINLHYSLFTRVFCHFPQSPWFPKIHPIHLIRAE